MAVGQIIKSKQYFSYHQLSGSFYFETLIKANYEWLFNYNTRRENFF